MFCSYFLLSLHSFHFVRMNKLNMQGKLAVEIMIYARKFSKLL